MEKLNELKSPENIPKENEATEATTEALQKMAAEEGVPAKNESALIESKDKLDAGRKEKLQTELEEIAVKEEQLRKSEKSACDGIPGPAVKTIARSRDKQREHLKVRKKEIEDILAGCEPQNSLKERMEWQEKKQRANPETQREEVQKLIDERGRKEREEMGPAYGPNYDSGTGGKRRPGGWSEISSNR